MKTMAMIVCIFLKTAEMKNSKFDFIFYSIGLNFYFFDLQGYKDPRMIIYFKNSLISIILIPFLKNFIFNSNKGDFLSIIMSVIDLKIFYAFYVSFFSSRLYLLIYLWIYLLIYLFSLSFFWSCYGLDHDYH